MNKLDSVLMLNLGWILPLSLTFFLCLLHCKFSQKAIIKSSNLKIKTLRWNHVVSVIYLFFRLGYLTYIVSQKKKKDLFSEFWLMVFININANWKGHWLFNFFFMNFTYTLLFFSPSECFKHAPLMSFKKKNHFWY